MLRKMLSIQSLLWPALLLALAGSLRHVAHTFTSIDANVVWGWVQAIAVDAGLFALALGISQRRRVKRKTLALWGGVVLFSAISIFANLAYGLAHTTTLPDWISVSKPYVLAGALPILVLYLAEIVGSDVSYAIKQAEKEERKAQRETVSLPKLDTLSLANATRQANAETAIAQLLAFYANSPDATQAEAGEAVSRSRQWVSAKLSELEQQGKLTRGNGQGVLVK